MYVFDSFLIDKCFYWNPIFINFVRFPLFSLTYNLLKVPFLPSPVFLIIHDYVPDYEFLFLVSATISRLTTTNFPAVRVSTFVRQMKDCNQRSAGVGRISLNKIQAHLNAISLPLRSWKMVGGAVLLFGRSKYHEPSKSDKYTSL